MKKNGKFAKRGVATKTMAMVLAVMLIVGVTVGGTLAWLVADATQVTNTFSVGNITIKLDENVDNTFKIVPGATATKDPYVTVKATSEKCYVYVTVENNLVINNAVVGDLNIGDEWIVVETVGNKTLYRYEEVVDAASADVELPVFTTVTYDGDAITAQNIGQLDGKQIIIDAFAHQSENITDSIANNAAIAWAFPPAASN